MRLLLTAAAGALALAVLRPHPAPSAPVAPSASHRATVSVAVDVQCRDGGVRFAVSPWRIELNQGDEVEWVLAPEADATEIGIVAKQADWPFVDSPPYRGARRSPPRGRNMKPNQAGRRYAYAIELVCDTGGGRADTVIVDPEMIIKSSR